MRLLRRSMSWSFVVCCLAILAGSRAWGFAEEQTDQSQNPQANFSTHHLLLTRALAVCAGLDYANVPNPISPQVLSHSEAKDAEIIAFNDEMTDIGTICMRVTPQSGQGQADAGPTKQGVPFTGNTILKLCEGSDRTWTNCSPGGIPDAAIKGDPSQCPAGSDTTAEVFPVLWNPQAPAGAWQPELGCFSQRFSPWSPLFHFPEESDLAVLKKFATEATPLQARAAYAYGPTGSNMWTGNCSLRPTEKVPTGVVNPGSTEAFGMYLHSLADYYSHRMCRDSWAAKSKKGAQLKPAWYFHTPGPGITPVNPVGVDDCGFNDHAFEFGCAESKRRAGFLAGSVNAAERVFEALLEFSAKKGKTPRVASMEANNQWLRRQVQRYVTLYQPSVLAGAGNPTQLAAAQLRVNFTWQLLQACVANAGAKPDACLPDVPTGGTCPAQGMVCNCTQGQKNFPIVPACGATQKKK